MIGWLGFYEHLKNFITHTQITAKIFRLPPITNNPPNRTEHNMKICTSCAIQKAESQRGLCFGCAELESEIESCEMDLMIAHHAPTQSRLVELYNRQQSNEYPSVQDAFAKEWAAVVEHEGRHYVSRRVTR